MKKSPKVLVVDNYDSFVFNLVHYLEEAGAQVSVMRNDEIDATQISQFDAILISPGPGSPESAGASISIVHAAAESSIPLLGVCLGHQAIAAAFGARVSSAPELLHGMTSQITHDQKGIFSGIPSPFTATRYHSLAIERDSLAQLNNTLTVTAESESGVVMAIAHTELPIFGVQFHPESVLTEFGHTLIENWLNLIY